MSALLGLIRWHLKALAVKEATWLGWLHELIELSHIDFRPWIFIFFLTLQVVYCFSILMKCIWLDVFCVLLLLTAWCGWCCRQRRWKKMRRRPVMMKTLRKMKMKMLRLRRMMRTRSPRRQWIRPSGTGSSSMRTNLSGPRSELPMLSSKIFWPRLTYLLRLSLQCWQNIFLDFAFRCRDIIWIHQIVVHIFREVFLTFMRESRYCYSASFVLSIAVLSVHLPLITWVDHSKTVQAKITKSIWSAAWKTLVSGFVKLFHKFKRGHPERGC